MTAKQVQFRRGTTAEYATFTGAVGEITVDTTAVTARVHDGSTVGGFPLAHAGANTDITSVLLNQTGLKVKGGSVNSLTFKPNETLGADRTLNFIVNDANRTIDLSGNLTVSSSATISGTSSGTNTGDQNIFQTIAVSGQSNVVADTTTDTLTLVAGTNITITTDASTDSITFNATGASVVDGDYGDITVSSAGTVWTIDNQAVTYAKIQNVSATDRILGRQTAGAGTIEEITCTSAGRALLDDATAADQRTTLGLGTIATQDANNVNITGGSITGITDLAIADGGTGASDAGTARTNLGLAIGTNVQAYDPDLSAIAALATTDGNIIVGDGSTWVAESGATARTSLGLGTDDNVTFKNVLASAAAGTGKGFYLQSAGVSRWALLSNTVAESGSNAGSNFALRRYSDAGASLGDVLTITRSTGTVNVGSLTLTTDLALADGGTGASLADPNADRIMFWDDSAGTVDWLTAGSGLTITGTTITATGLSETLLVDNASVGTGSTYTINATTITSAYKIFIIAFNGVSRSGGGTNSLQILLSGNNGSTYTAAINIGAPAGATATYSGMVMVLNADTTSGSRIVTGSTADTSTSTLPFGVGTSVSVTTGYINALQFTIGGSNFDAGTVSLVGLA